MTPPIDPEKLAQQIVYDWATEYRDELQVAILSALQSVRDEALKAQLPSEEVIMRKIGPEMDLWTLESQRGMFATVRWLRDNLKSLDTPSKNTSYSYQKSCPICGPSFIGQCKHKSTELDNLKPMTALSDSELNILANKWAHDHGIDPISAHAQTFYYAYRAAEQRLLEKE